jgi:IgGFc binding protein
MQTIQNVRALVGMAIFVSGAALVGAACGSDRIEFRQVPSPGPLGDQDAAPACSETVRCSRDLKQVIHRFCDGTEKVVDCDPGLGCGGGACVDACTSAELSKGSIGCSFATLPPDEPGSARGSCFAAIVANVWDRPVSLQATLGAEPIDIGQSTYYAEMNGTSVEYTRVNGAIDPGKVAIVFLSEADGGGGFGFIPCPTAVVPALKQDPILHKTARTRAFRITTDAPVSAYSMWPYGGADSATPSATLLLPISSWDKNYIAVSTWNPDPGAPNIQIIGAEDNTTVKMRPNVNIIGGVGIEGTTEGQTQTWTINRGEVLQITQRADTTGSPIEADKPIGLFGGSECTFLMGSACDVTQQQIPPVSQWGREYALVPWRPRAAAGTGTTTARETLPWRFVGAKNGTKLTYDPARPGGAPETLEAGQVVTFVASELVTVRAQDDKHPFYAGMFMTGGIRIANQTPNAGPAIGDPDFVNVVPSEQFLDHYIFFVDHTYPESTLTLVRRKTETGFKPVTLDCAGEITDWQPLGLSGEYEYAWVYLTKASQPQRFGDGGTTCGYGRREAQSDGPFSVYVWGTDVYASYGYAGGMGSRPLSDVKGPPIE